MIISFFIFVLIQKIHCDCYEGYNDCLKCQNNICILCQYGGVETNKDSVHYGKCVSCPKRCIKCQSDVHQCTKCKDEYHLDNNPDSITYNQCFACPDNCYECNDDGECIVCNDGYGLDASKKCIRCIPSNCHQCNYSDICIHCNGPYEVKDGQCVVRESHCFGSNEDCIHCLHNYCSDRDPNSKTFGQCFKCSTRIRHCKNGYIDEDGKKICNTCKSGYTSYSDKCYECPPNCSKCESLSRKCIVCKPHFHLRDTNCIPCEDPKCLKCDESTSECTECEDNYVSQNGKCTLINKIENCENQIDGEKCLKCKFGYGLDPDQKCQKCKDPKCIECYDNYEKCTECYSKLSTTYFLDDDGTCTLNCKDPLCRFCNYRNASQCIVCIDGYLYSEINQKCEENPIENCAQYVDYYDYCSNCLEGYALVDSKTCKPCEENCAKCSTDTQKECYTCKSGFHLNKDTKKCIKCFDENCDSCPDSEFICYSCKPFYGLDFQKESDTYGKCIKCNNPNCQKCDNNPNSCQKCTANYYKNGTDCTLEIYIESDPYYDSITDNTPDIDDGLDDYIEEEVVSSSDVPIIPTEELSGSIEEEILEKSEPAKKGKKLSGGAIAGIVIAVIVVVGLVVGLLVYFLVIKKSPVGASSDENS